MPAVKKCPFLLTLNFCFVLTAAFSQKEAPERNRFIIDSSLRVLPTLKADTQIAELYRAVSFRYSMAGELDKMKDCLDKALKLCDQHLNGPLTAEEKRSWTTLAIYIYQNHTGYVNQTGKDQLQEDLYAKLLAQFEKIGSEDGIAELKMFHGDYCAHHNANYERALALCTDALARWSITGNKKMQIRTCSYLGRFYKAIDDYPSALKHFFQSMKAAEELNDSISLANVYHQMGNCYRAIREYETARDYLLKGLAMRTTLKKSDLICGSYGALGILYNEMGDDNLALEFHNKALKMAQESGDWTFETMTLNNISIIYTKKKKFREAIDNLWKAVDIRRKNHDLDGEAWYMNSLSETFVSWEKPDSALACSFMALKLLESVGNKEYYIRTYYNMALAYTLQKKYSTAVEYAVKAMGVAKEMNSVQWVIELHQQLSTIYSESGDHKRSLEQFKLYTSKKDSLFNQENTKKKLRTEMTFEFDKKEQAMILEQEKKDAIAEEEKSRQRIVTWSVTGGLLLVLLFAGVLFNRFRLIRKQKDIIEEQKAMVDEKNKSITDSINYAQRIQKALLASDDLLGKHLKDHFILFKPKDIVSGDFYWAVEKEGRFYLAVCDSTGHGVPGAFMSLLNISYMNEAISEKNMAEPGLVFNHTRSKLIESISADGGKDGMDGVLVCFDKGKVNYSAANNPPVLISKGALKEFPADKMPVGKGETQRDFETHNIPAEKGDILYLYTDGYADQFGGPKGKKFKYRQLEELLLSIHSKPMEEQKNILSSTIEEWRSDLEQVDDILIIGIRI